MLDALLCDSYVKYEHPLNEKIRIFLRIEHIWHDLEYSIKQENDASCIIGLLNILSLLEINERFELRSEAIKYLDKLLVKFYKMQQQPNIDLEKLQVIIDQLISALNSLKSVMGRTAASLSSNEWLSTIRQKMLSPGGLCAADLPFLKYWQEFPLKHKIQQLSRWQEEFHPLVNAISKILFYIRKTTKTLELSSVNGSYQQLIDNQVEPQLISLEVPKIYKVYPEISGNRYRLSVRFLQTDLVNKSVVYSDDLDFKLSICW